ncbi:hypothetical protein GDO86_014863 [Hymenochirus boettgeri]|uniref:Protein transport protein sec16 n=1 Tax=Hymenochirus boettgeri TaxID=247094 RepID=A0A8T2JVV7_9PIPI|nr:hypothetical protein GDO86_014863 [Hymenochirus boettgeri]
MQPPPQAGPPGASAPPMGMSNATYWRKRGPTAAPVTSAPVRPVTDPFAFGRMTPQNTSQGNSLNGNPPVMPSPSPSFYPPPVPVNAQGVSEPLLGAQASISGSLPHATAKGGMYTSASAPAAGSIPFTDYPAATSSAQHGLVNTQTFPNTVGGHQTTYLPSRVQTTQAIATGVNSSGTSTAPVQSFVPVPPQQAGSWGSLPSVPPTSTHNFPLPVQHPSHNAPYYSPPYLEVSNLPPQTGLLPSDPGHQSIQQRAVPAPFPPVTGSGNTFPHSSAQANSINQTDYMHRHEPEQSSWFNQPYSEHRHHPFPNPDPIQPPSQPAVSENKPVKELDDPSGRASTNADSGTVSMFFKVDEAENVEIVLSDKQSNSNTVECDTSHYQNISHQTVPSSHPEPAVTNIPSLTSISLTSGAPLFVNNEPNASWRPDVFSGSDASSKPAVGTDPPYDNFENIECVQNQEVPPSEPSSFSLFPATMNSDPFRYGLPPGTSQPKNISGQSEGGPNMETPDTLAPPVRSDSVSSSYSSLSHRSLPMANRPQDLTGTFIQKESGKLECDSSNSFFKQIDSSPMVGDAVPQNMGQHPYHSSLSQPPTPSPPKPTGIFMTSANSSFEPVRSHSIGVKHTELDQPKTTREINESHKVPPNYSIPATSPGKINAPSNGNLFHPENISLLLEKRPSSRAQGSNKKCESPATTLWAQGELPNFGGNVLLAPAAPTLYVAPKPQREVIQPPEDGSSVAESGKYQASPEEQVSSENLENPPKLGDEEHPPSQASSGYASLLSSPPTEALQNQPVLIAQPIKNYTMNQPINFSLSLPNQIKNVNSLKDPGTFEKQVTKVMAPSGNFTSDDISLLSLNHSRPMQGNLDSSNLSNYKAPNDNYSEPVSNQHPVGPRQSSVNQAPLNLVAESPVTVKADSMPLDPGNKSVIPPSAPKGPRLPLGQNGCQNYQVENMGALDFTVPRAQVNPIADSNVPLPSQQGKPVFTAQPNTQPGPDINRQGFYQQVTNDVPQPVVHNQQGAAMSQEYMVPLSQSAPSAPAVPAGKPVSYPQHVENQIPNPQNPVGPSYPNSSEPKYGGAEQSTYPVQPAASMSAPVNHVTSYLDQARPPPSHTPQQVDPYYYYNRPYGAYPQPYPAMDPRTAPHYYQDPYAAYDPAYRQYSNSGFVNPGKYPYQEPERPSSRSSHSSDRPPSRQGYSSKSDWSAQSSYYSNYYQGQYDYADPSRWDRYPGAYDPGYRDPRSVYWNYMYSNRDDVYQRPVPNAYTSRYDVYEDRWQYDPRYVGGFDEDGDPRRDLLKDDFDRRSVHSEHSAHSVHSGRSAHSRRSSFSSHSQHSQIYKSQQDLTTAAYEAQMPNPALNEYAYGMYANDYSNQQAIENYQYSYAKGTEWQPVEQVPSRPLTPEKFGSPHVCARFGPGGHLIKVLSNLPSDGQPALVEIHNMEVIMLNTAEQEQLRSFPGPLVKDETHKVDVINFAQRKSKECLQNEHLLDQESASLLWDFIVLLCRQNGTVVGTDIAELLLQDHKTVWLPGKSPNEANLIDFSNEPLEQEEESPAAQLSFLTDNVENSGKSLDKETERFRELLLFGRKKDALESAMKNGLWGHALLLASKMDSRTHARVMTRFANSLPINDPLQTVYQLLSGRMPAAATCCGDEKWGDWRPHLAMVLSNLTSNVDVPARTMTTMGDTLASRGLMDAAHFCYLMAQVGFGVYTKKSTKLVLIGSNHSLSFAKFASNEAIQRTEAYEYAQSLGTQSFALPNIQVFKFIYACRLAEHGLSAQAFHYCEVISKTILRHPSCYSPVLISQLLKVSSHLRFFDPQLKEKPEQEQFIDPFWLQHLRNLDTQMKHGSVVYDAGRSTPHQFGYSTPSSELEHASQSEGAGPAASDIPNNTENPLLANLLPNMMPSVNAVLSPPGPENLPPLYQPYVSNDPSYPGTPQTLAPPSGPPTPANAPNFMPFGVEQPPFYPPTAMQAFPLPPQQATEFNHQEQLSQDPGLQRMVQNSPTKTTFHDPENDFYRAMENMAPGQRSRTVSQSSSHLKRTRTTSESSVHSMGSGRRSSIGMQPSPPPAPIPEAIGTEKKKEQKSHGASQRIVWDEKKQRWINMDEPEGEDNKPPPPPPSGIPMKQPSNPSVPGGPPNPSVNMFSIRAAGARGRYVDVLNPGGTRPAQAIPPPADLFAPLAPMPIPANLFVPAAVPQEAQPAEATGAEAVSGTDQPGFDNPEQIQFQNSAHLPLGAEHSSANQEEGQLGENLTNEAPPAVPFYNPSQFAQPPLPSAASGGARPGRLGQRKYPPLK